MLNIICLQRSHINFKGYLLKSYRKELWLNIPSRLGFVNITPEVDTALRESGVQEGLTLVTASSSLLPLSRECHLRLGALAKQVCINS